MKHNVRKTLCLLLTIAFVLSACMACAKPAEEKTPASVGGSASSEQKYKETLIVGIDTEPVSLDSHSDGDTASLIAMKMVYDTLVQLDPVTKEIIPMLAESWNIKDELTYEFKLREDVLFSDGNKMTAEDVKFSMERQQKLLRNISPIESVESFEVTGEYTIVFHLSAPSAPMLTLLALPTCSIQSKHVMDGGEWKYIGCGPYVCTDWKAGDAMTFTRNENYWGGCPKTKTVIFRLIPEPSSRLIALETHEIDVCQKVSANDKDKIANNPELCVFEAPSAGVEYVVLNCARAPFDNVKVRQALSAATNREDLVQAVFRGEGVVCNTPLGYGVTYHADDLDDFSYNPEQAKQLLKEAGYPDGFKFTMLVKGSQQQLTAQVLQAQYQEVGITLDIQFAENTAFFDSLNRGDFDAGMITLSNSSGEPVDQFDKLYGDNLGSAGNRGHYINPEFDALYDASMAETDFEKRGEIFHKMQQIIVNDNPFICMMCANLFTGAVKGLEGYTQVATNTSVYRNIYLPID